MLMPLGMTIMTRAAGPARMGRLMAILGVPMLLGPIFGPILGGWLIEVASWHWIFLINVPIGIVAVLYALWALPSDAPGAVRVLRRRRHAAHVAGPRALPLRHQLHPGGGDRHLEEGARAAVHRARHARHLRLLQLPPQHPLLDLRLFRNRRLSIATITMFLFAAAFFGGLLLVPTYFQQVRGLDTLHAAFLMVPQGLGAMVTMPIAGALSDRIPVGRIVPFGLLLMTGGMFALTQVGTDTPYWGFMIPVLFVMGLGMGGTMMPLMTSALKTLQSHQVARGSTLLNITQQIASSIGVAVISVVFTNYLATQAARRTGDRGPERPGARGHVGGQAARPAGSGPTPPTPSASTFLVAAILLALTLIPAAFLPRKHEHSHFLDDQPEAAPVIVH